MLQNLFGNKTRLVKVPLFEVPGHAGEIAISGSLRIDLLKPLGKTRYVFLKTVISLPGKYGSNHACIEGIQGDGLRKTKTNK